jgi:hypothetical protein
MSLITRSSDASLDLSSATHIPQIPDLVAGEAIDIAAPCYIKTSDGKAWMSNATSANEAAEVVGFAARAAVAGEKVTLFGVGARFRYASSGLSAGAMLYLGATAGRLDDGATTGDAFGYAVCLNATDIMVVRVMPVLTSATVGAGTIDATALAANAVTTTKILAANVTEAKIEAGAAGAGLTGLVTKFVADDQVIGGIPVIHPVIIAAGAVGAKNVTLTHKTRVIDAWVVMKGAGVASCTLTVGNAGNAITNAMDVSGSDQAVVRCTSINDAYYEIAGGGSLRVTTAAGATQPDCIVFVLGYRVA